MSQGELFDTAGLQERLVRDVAPYRFRPRQVLRFEEGELLYTATPETTLRFEDSNLPSMADACRDAHVISERSERLLTESLLMCYLAQANYSEQLFKFFHRMKDEPTENLRDMDWLLEHKAPFRFKKSEDRLSPIFGFINTYGGIGRLAEDFLAEPFETRELLVREVDWMGPKTASYWYYTIGGSELMTLDQHVLEQAAGLGVEMDSRLVNPAPRKSGVHQGKPVRQSPSRREYWRIEDDLKTILSGYDASRDPSFWSTALWYAGVMEDRRQRFGVDPRQEHLLNGTSRFVYPYSR